MIEGTKFKVEYNYDDLENSEFNSYERHIIWRYEYLGIGEEQVNKKDREILKKYLQMAQILRRKEKYETGIYISDIENKVAYNTDEVNEEKKDDNNFKNTQKEESKYINNEYKPQTKRKNQLLLSEEQIRRYEEQHRKKNNNSI